MYRIDYKLHISKQNYNEFIYISKQFIKITHSLYAME